MRSSSVFVGLLWYILNTGLPGVSAGERLLSRDTMDAELKRAASCISKAPHPRFRTPRDTWEAWLKSVTEGDLLLFSACHTGDEKEEMINLDALAPNERARLLEETRRGAKNVSLEVIKLQYNEVSPNRSRLRATMVSTEGEMQITSTDEFELVDTDEGWKISKWTRVAPEVRRHLDNGGRKPPISAPRSSSQ